MQTFEFRTAAVTVSEGIVTAIFADGKQNEMNTNWLDAPWYHEIATDMGFGENWQYYAVTHELTHHWLADRLAWSHSWSVYDDTRYAEKWPDHIAWEEHIVNQLQRYVMTGKLDEYNVLFSVFGESLPSVKLELLMLYASAK